jgi:hypothetical protein
VEAGGHSKSLDPSNNLQGLTFHKTTSTLGTRFGSGTLRNVTQGLTWMKYGVGCATYSLYVTGASV